MYKPSAGTVRSEELVPVYAYRVVVVVVVAVSVGSAIAAFSVPGKNSTDSPLWVDKNSLDFGTVLYTDDFTWQVPITNQSHEPIRIEAIRTSCGCAQALEHSFVIAPGASHDIPFSINLAEARPTIREDIREVHFTFTPIQGHPTKPTKNRLYTVHGLVQMPFTECPSFITLECEFVHGLPPPPVELRIRPGRGIRVESLRCDSKFATAELTEPDESGEVLPFLLLSQEIENGRFTFPIVVNFANAVGNGPVCYTKTITVQGTKRGAVDVKPDALVLGLVQTATAKREFTLSSDRSPIEGVIVERWLPSAGTERYERSDFAVTLLGTNALTHETTHRTQMIVEFTARKQGPVKGSLALRMLLADGLVEHVVLSVGGYVNTSPVRVVESPKKRRS